MSRLRRLCIVMVMAVLALTGLGFPAVQQANANPVACSGPVIAFGRQRWCGYFKNIGFNQGLEVRLGGIPASVNTAQEFINLVINDLNSGNAHRRTGAQFIILTMIGRGPGAPKAVSAAQQADWIARVRSYANVSENGTTSFGENGRIDWKVWQHLPCGTVNTYYQAGQDDVAPNRTTPANSDCETSLNDEFLLFRNLSGGVVYRIRRECMNPMGQMNALASPPANEYKLTPAITTTVGGVPVNTVEAGQTIRFSYAVVNDGPDPSPSASCTIYTNVHPGYFPDPPTPTASGGAGPPTGCPRVFPDGTTSLMFEDVPVAAGNQTICRSLFVNPATPSGGAAGDEECVPVVNKPYFKIYGGDISAGGGQSITPGTCSNNAQAAIIGWNKHSGAYPGTSVQFAGLALDHIYDVATSFGNGGGSAPPPRGLAFANQGAGHIYGGSFGSLPCITDYYSSKPAAAMPFTSLPAATTSGAYATSGPGPFTISGAVPADKRITIYVDGDVFINNNIIYQGSWSAGTTPLFELVVKGNIYIRNTVTRLDGVYIAQKNGVVGGTIYSCATAAAALVPGPSLHATCNNGLTINGAFIASSVQFLRTRGTLQQSTAGEGSSSANLAEVFNFSPALWMAQPPGVADGPVKYDSITSLPPIL
jgi:hypothetical protein